jgi:hypothetical protein
MIELLATATAVSAVIVALLLLADRIGPFR